MASDERRPNHRLRVARLQRGWTREQLAEQVAVFLAAEGGRQSAMDANHVYKLERGEITWPNASYRRALRDLFGADSDAALGFYCKRSAARSVVGADHDDLDVPRRRPPVAPTVLPVRQGHDCHGHVRELRLTLVGGFAGSGKTEFGKELSAITGWALLDKDALTRPLAERLLRSLGGDPNDRHTALYKQHVRPLEYDCLLGAAFDNLECGVPTVLTSPFLAEMPNEGWLRRLASMCIARRATMSVIWVHADVEAMRDYLAYRNASRDRWKLDNWADYLTTIDLEMEPSFRHFAVDNRGSAVRSLTAQARTFVDRVEG